MWRNGGVAEGTPAATGTTDERTSTTTRRLSTRPAGRAASARCDGLMDETPDAPSLRGVGVARQSSSVRLRANGLTKAASGDQSVRSEVPGAIRLGDILACCRITPQTATIRR